MSLDGADTVLRAVVEIAPRGVVAETVRGKSRSRVFQVPRPIQASHRAQRPRHRCRFGTNSSPMRPLPKKGHEDAVAIADKATTALKDEQSKLDTLQTEYYAQVAASNVLDKTLSEERDSRDTAANEAQRASDAERTAKAASDNANTAAAGAHEQAVQSKTDADKAKTDADAAITAVQPLETAEEAAHAEMAAAVLMYHAALGTAGEAKAKATFDAKSALYNAAMDETHNQRTLRNMAGQKANESRRNADEAKAIADRAKTDAEATMLIAEEARRKAAITVVDFKTKHAAFNVTWKTSNDDVTKSNLMGKRLNDLREQISGLQNLSNQANEAVSQALSKRSAECDKLIGYLVSNMK